MRASCTYSVRTRTGTVRKFRSLRAAKKFAGRRKVQTACEFRRRPQVRRMTFRLKKRSKAYVAKCRKSAKYERCVKAVKKALSRYRVKVNPWAVCTVSVCHM